MQTMPAEQMEVFGKMIQESHPWAEYIKTNALKDNTASPRYASRGRWSGLYYLMSGDASFAQRSLAEIKKLSNNFQSPIRPGNDTREHTIESIFLYDWLYPALSNEEKQSYLNWLEATAEGCITDALRVVDSDQVTGTYFFFALMDSLLGTDLLSREVRNGQGGKFIPMGGLEATAADYSTYRNAIHRYITVMSVGGQWIESQEYNLGTPFLLHMGHVAMKNIHGKDYFPEYEEFLRQQRLYHRHELIPGLKFAFQWGDVQDSHGLHWANRDSIYSILRSSDPEFAQFESEVNVAFNRTIPLGNNPSYPRYFYYTSPHQEKSDWVNDTPKFLVTLGTGHAYWRTGWDIPDRATHLLCHNFNSGYVDHQPNQFGDLQVARDGRFILDHPISYTPPHVCPNALLVCNSAPSREQGALTEYASGDTFAYAAGTNCGKGPDITGTYYPPPTYLHENTRAIFELLDGPDTVIVIWDRVYTDDPRVQLRSNGSPAIERYPAAAQSRMKAALGLKDILFHTPVSPTLEERSFSWTIPNTTIEVTIEQIHPERNLSYTVVDEVATALDVKPTERKFCVHAVAPEDDILPSFECFLHVLSTGSTVIYEPLWADIDACGVLIGRPDLVDVAILFSTISGPIVTIDEADLSVVTEARKITETFEFDLPERTQVYLADLDPKVVWKATLDGRSIIPSWIGDLIFLTCEAGGTLALWANEEPPLPSPPDWKITEQTANRIVLEREIEKIDRKDR